MQEVSKVVYISIVPMAASSSHQFVLGIFFITGGKNFQDDEVYADVELLGMGSNSPCCSKTQNLTKKYYGGIMTTFEDSILHCGGFDSAANFRSKKCYLYNITLDKWELYPEEMIARDFHASVRMIGGSQEVTTQRKPSSLKSTTMKQRSLHHRWIYQRKCYFITRSK